MSSSLGDEDLQLILPILKQLGIDIDPKASRSVIMDIFNDVLGARSSEIAQAQLQQEANNLIGAGGLAYHDPNLLKIFLETRKDTEEIEPVKFTASFQK